MTPFALPGGYPSPLALEEYDRNALAYGGNLTLLRAIKKRFDPDNVFSSSIPLTATHVEPQSIGPTPLTELAQSAPQSK